MASYHAVMATAKLGGKGSPKGLSRLFFRAPIWLYKARLGFLLGHRFVMIEHVGRKSGLKRQVVLEVVANEPDATYVAAAWGDRAQWLKNVRANSRVTVHLAGSRFETDAEIIDKDAAHEVLTKYAQHHPRALAGLSRFMLEDPGGTLEEQVDNVSEVVPFVRLPKPQT